MTQYSDLLRLTLQETGENDGTWGDVANQGVFELVEDAAHGLVIISLNAGNVVLSANNGATDQARMAILVLTGTLAAAREVQVPALSHRYLISNQTTGGQTVTIKTAAGVGFVAPEGEDQIVWCDGTDCAGISVASADTANTATTATSAVTAAQLGGVVAASYARLDQGGTDQNFSKSQTVARVSLTPGPTVAVDAALSNAFILIPTQNFTLNNPSNPSDGQTFRLIIKQDATGGRVITWGSQYKFPGGVQAILSTDPDAIDYFAFEYYAADAIWVGGGALDMG